MPFPRIQPSHGLVFALSICALVARADEPAQSPALSATATPATAEQIEFFERSVRPLLAERCWKCHGPEKQKGGLRLDSRKAILAGGDTGPAFAPGDTAGSLLISAVRYAPDGYQMPPEGKLPDAEIAVLERWISDGAPWPAQGAAVGSVPPVTVDAATQGVEQAILARAQTHWAFQPIAEASPPQVRDMEWARTPVDRFILARLEAAGLVPSPAVDRPTWLRRVTFDLLGLPPTPEELSDFLDDGAAGAEERVVDRLLASPHYGERWARHWLDLVRFAETAGHEFDFDLPDAWRYRDYCIRALNEDLSYFDFLREHLAGDQLPQRRDPATANAESIVGTAFFYLGESKHSPVSLAVDRAERVDNQLDVLSKTFFGLTLSCSRCHDHKFDPLLSRDYYALAGLLKSSRYTQARIDPPEPRQALCARAETVQRQVAEHIAFPDSEAATSRVHDTLVARGAEPLETFEAADWNGWTTEGEAFGTAPRTASSARIAAPSGQAPRVEQTAQATADSGHLLRAATGTLRSPSFTLSTDRLWYRVRGEGCRVRLILDNFQRIQEPIYGPLEFAVASGDRWVWHSQNVAMWRGLRGYIELLDSGAGWVALDDVWQANGDPPSEPESPGSSGVDLSQDTALRALADEIAAYESQYPAPAWTMAMVEGTPENERLHIRGSPVRLGDEVPRGGPHCLGMPVSAGGIARSGRRELAELLCSRSCPLPARVMANRVWHYHLGAGLVRSPDDFGAMGQRPTHPELLDYLASELHESRGSLKHLHRLIVLSATYRQSSRADAASLAMDGENRLWSRAAIRRLEGEAIRDALLVLSGRLDRTAFGPSVLPHLTESMQGRGRPATSGPLDGNGRRTIYLGVRRNFLSPFLMAFDYPKPFTTIGRRNVSNVPAQALAMMNNPFVHQQAELWARRLAESEAPVEDRICQAWRAALLRDPSPEERAAASQFWQQTAGFAQAVSSEKAGARVSEANNTQMLDAWRALCLAVLNMKEFIFIP